MMRVLYLLSTNPDGFPPALMPSPGDAETSAVLLQDAVYLDALPMQHIYVLDEDLKIRHHTSPYPRISYRDLVRLIFEADRVLAL